MTKKIIPLILAGIFLLSAPATAQQSSVDRIISDLYESISFDETKDPDYDKFKSLFIIGGRLISVGDTTSSRLTPTTYEKAMTKQRQNGKLIAFEEKELHRETEQYGNIMHIFSTYATETKTPQGKTSERGINSIQLMKKDGDWKVVSIIWYEEDQAHPLPDKYLPMGNQ